MGYVTDEEPAQHNIILKTVSVKIGSCLSLAREIYTLQAVASSVGIPLLY